MLAECLGYVGRILSSKESPNYSIGLFVLQSTPTLLAPVLFAATIYMCLGRIIRATEGQHLSPIKPSWLTKMFVAGDVLGLGVQGAGNDESFHISCRWLTKTRGCYHATGYTSVLSYWFQHCDRRTCTNGCYFWNVHPRRGHLRHSYSSPSYTAFSFHLFELERRLVSAVC